MQEQQWAAPADAFAR